MLPFCEKLLEILVYGFSVVISLVLETPTDVKQQYS